MGDELSVVEKTQSYSESRRYKMTGSWFMRLIYERSCP
jgi:hypothetical protein